MIHRHVLRFLPSSSILESRLRLGKEQIVRSCRGLSASGRAQFSGRGIGGRWGRHSCLRRIGEWRTFLSSRTDSTRSRQSDSNPLGGAGMPRTRGFGQTGMTPRQKVESHKNFPRFWPKIEGFGGRNRLFAGASGMSAPPNPVDVNGYHLPENSGTPRRVVFVGFASANETWQVECPVDDRPNLVPGPSRTM